MTTIKVFQEHFPISGSILDCAAGTGIYAFYFAEKGYHVTTLDITPRHIDIINDELSRRPFKMQTAVNDSTDLSGFKDESFDIVLCMGPIYHLTDEQLRKKCLEECKRVLKSNGLLAVAYINRFFIFPYVAINDQQYLSKDLGKKLVETGILLHDDPDCFWTDSYYAVPQEMVQLYTEMGFEIVDHLSPDGLSPLLHDKVDNMNTDEFKAWCDYHYLACREKSILGAGNHGLIIGRKR